MTIEKDSGRSMTPELPPGYFAQPVRGFLDRTGLITWEFFRVYGIARPRAAKRYEGLRLQDKDLSYWRVTWAPATGSEARPVGHSMSLGEHRKSGAPRMTFDQFFSLSPQQLATLLPPGEG